MKRRIFVLYRFPPPYVSIIKDPLSTDGSGTWYPQACKFLKIKHHIHLSLMREAL
jgi:putative transposase